MGVKVLGLESDLVTYVVNLSSRVLVMRLIGVALDGSLNGSAD